MTRMALSAGAQARPAPAPADKVLDLIDVAREFAIAADVEGVGRIVKVAARRLLGADGVTFVLREGDLVRYADEDAISPLWKGTAFPASSCVSGWAMDHRETVAIEDVYADPRVPHDAYRPTFVKGMLMVPVLTAQPVAAIGAYWAERHAATPREAALLEAIAGFAAAALQRAKLERELRSAVALRDELLGPRGARAPDAAHRHQPGRERRGARAGGGRRRRRPPCGRAPPAGHRAALAAGRDAARLDPPRAAGDPAGP
jgi:GAF domain-containing protein